MARHGKWETIRELGGGGQGTVHLAVDTDRFDELRWKRRLKDLIQSLSAGQTLSDALRDAKEFPDHLQAYADRLNPANIGALKVLHGLGPSADLEKAQKRMAREVESLRSMTHPNLLRILDSNLKENWFVSEYHPRGPLSKHPTRYQGDVIGALKAFRGVVDGVAALNEANLIHRDIKPANVFLANDDRLVLGDMGLVFRDEMERATETYENAGSRDWMPPWAMGMRLEDVKPCFDVFSLGKLLWFMVSGKSILRLWYHRRPEFDVEAQFPGDERMRWVNHLLDGCVREEADECWASAKEFLENVDKILDILRRQGEVLGRVIKLRCRVCGVGTYGAVVTEGMKGGAVGSFFGSRGVSDLPWRIYVCGHCGHVQMFSLNQNPQAWQE